MSQSGKLDGQTNEALWKNRELSVTGNHERRILGEEPPLRQQNPNTVQFTCSMNRCRHFMKPLSERACSMSH
jgi:hypothetical protein